MSSTVTVEMVVVARVDVASRASLVLQQREQQRQQQKEALKPPILHTRSRASSAVRSPDWLAGWACLGHRVWPS